MGPFYHILILKMIAAAAAQVIAGPRHAPRGSFLHHAHEEERNRRRPQCHPADAHRTSPGGGRYRLRDGYKLCSA
jgi:hypothetical protein